jgi:multidrug efflux system membrane fusion protein
MVAYYYSRIGRRLTVSGIAAAMAILLVTVAATGCLSHKDGKPEIAQAKEPQGNKVRGIGDVFDSTSHSYLSGTGTVVGFNTVAIKSRVDGAITQITFSEGQDIKKGELLFVIDSRSLESTVEQNRAALLKDQAIFEDAAADLNRGDQLFSAQIISRQQHDAQQAAVNEDRAIVAADQAQFDNSALQLGYTQITSPIGGRIGLRQIDVGNEVHATDGVTLATVTQIQPIAVLFFLPADTLREISSAMRNRHLRIEAFTEDDNTKLDVGFLSTIDTALDASTGSVKLKGVFPNRQRTLWPGEFVHVRLDLRSERKQ